MDKLLRTRNFSISKLKHVDENDRINGLDWPANVTTMIGYKRLSNIESCINITKRNNIDGDLIEIDSEAVLWRKEK